VLLAIPLLVFRRVIFATNVGNVDVRWWELQAHLVHRVRDDLRYTEVAKPLVVCGNNVPWRMLRARQCQRIFVCFDVLRPQLALRVVAFADLPVPRWIVEPLFEA
jgi:hypothetical protein